MPLRCRDAWGIASPGIWTTRVQWQPPRRVFRGEAQHELRSLCCRSPTPVSSGTSVLTPEEHSGRGRK